MFNIKKRLGRNGDPFACYLDFKRFVVSPGNQLTVAAIQPSVLWSSLFLYPRSGFFAIVVIPSVIRGALARIFHECFSIDLQK